MPGGVQNMAGALEPMQVRIDYVFKLLAIL